MNWFRKPKASSYLTITPRKIEDRREVTESTDEWYKCPGCNTVYLRRDYVAALSVCRNCGRHERMAARDRIDSLLDPGTFVEHDAGLVSSDPLRFEDKRKYSEYLSSTRAKTGINDAVVAGMGALDAMPVSIAAFEFAFMGGSMGSVVGEKITRSLERALEARCPAITVVSTGGARMQEGILSLMQMAKTSLLCHQLHEERVPYVVILADPSTAGVMASFASLGDLIIAEPNAYIGFAGKRVIEQTIKQVLPPSFQTAEFQRDQGFVDMVVPRPEMRARLASVLRMLQGLPAATA
ncbi:MAG: acetyl-CoA carboxylase, carboxyltransferase subunit beta [Candidatus Sumerlaeia bacterium]|nr:acetyl-CoA carboxylase, carboxyltransferase subunit beta [Candidatus Sumerlaeia bacterium]